MPDQPYKMSVEERCSSLGWDITDLSHEAHIDRRTAERAYEGHEPSARTKKDICSAFSDAFGYEVKITDIRWNVDVGGFGMKKDGPWNKK